MTRMRQYLQNLLLLVLVTDIIKEFQCKETKITFKEFLNDNTNSFNRLQFNVGHNENTRANIEIEMNEIGSLFQLDDFYKKANNSRISFNELYQNNLNYGRQQYLYDQDTYEEIAQNKRIPYNQQNHKIVVLTTNRIKDALDDPSIDTSIKRSEAQSPLDEKKLTPPPTDISDPSDQQLNNMKRAQEMDQIKQARSPETQQPMETKSSQQVYGVGGEKLESEEEERLKALHDESAPKEPIKIVDEEEQDKEKKDSKKDKNITAGCDETVDDGIMNCENGKNQIRIDDVNQKSIEKEVQELPAYEISLYYGLVLCLLIIIVLLLAKFREALSKYLEKYYIKSLRIVVLDVIILMSLNTLVQIMYYNRILDVIQLEYFNIYGFTITFSFFSISWLFIATIYAFILQKFSNNYALYEEEWKLRDTFLRDGPDEETDDEFEERLKKIQYFLIKEDFIMPISHLCYSEPMVLREDFDFAEYLGRAQAKCHLQLFNISLSTLLILITFFLIVSLIDIIENWLIECLLILLLPIISFSVGWIENKRQFNIINELLTVCNRQYQIESIKFFNLDFKKSVEFKYKLEYPNYITDEFSYDEEGVSRHVSLFPFRAVSFPLKIVHFTLVLQLVWIMVFLFNYSSQLVDYWECQLLFSIGLFLILFQLFIIIPFFLKKYAVNAYIQQLKDPYIIEKVISNQKEKVTLSFQRFYRLLKQLRRQKLPKKNHIKLRAEITDQLREIDNLKLKSINKLTHKLGFYKLQIEEYYYLQKAFTEVAQQSSSSSINSPIEQMTHFNIDLDRDNENQNNNDTQERPTANPRNRMTHNQDNQQGAQEEEKKEEESINLSHDDSFQDDQSQKKSEKEHDSSIDYDPQEKSKLKSKNKLEDSNDDKLKSEDKSEIDVNFSEKLIKIEESQKKQQKTEDKIEKSGHSEGQPSPDKSDEQFTLNKLLKVCSLYTQEVVLDPFKASKEILEEIFFIDDKKNPEYKNKITLIEFKNRIKEEYQKLEQDEEQNIILQQGDIDIIFSEVNYLQDQYSKIHLDRVASLIRNSIEMLPR